MGLKCKLTWRIKVGICHFNKNMHFVYFISISRPIIFIISFTSLISQLLFFITSSSDVQFLIRLILWHTHSTDFLGIAPDNQIHYSLLHIFPQNCVGLNERELVLPLTHLHLHRSSQAGNEVSFLIPLLYSANF